MKRNVWVRILTAAALLPLFVTCSFESDGNFTGLVAGMRRDGPVVLQPPSNVQAADDSSGGIRITWEVSDKADGYTVYRAPADNPTRFVRRGSSSGTTYTDSGSSVPPGVPYYYYLTAYNSTEVSGPSGRAGPALAARNQVILEAPQITSAVVSGNDITVTWTAVTGAVGYILYRASMYDGDVYIFRLDTEATSYKDDNLSAGSYLYQVRGYNDGGEGYVSVPSDPVGVGTGPVLPAPAAPRNLRAVADYAGTEPVINVSWNAVANAGSYHVYRSVDDEYYEKIGETSSTTYRDESGIRSGEAYYYRVRGYNGTQEGYLSDSYGPVLLLPGKPEIVATVTANTVTVSWQALYGADIYYVYRSTDNSQFRLLTERGTGDTSYTDLGLAAGTYYYYVEAANSAGRGLASASVQAVMAVNAAPPVITSHPTGGTYLRNVPASPLTVQVSVSDGGTLSYQWYSNAGNSNSGGTLISSATGSSYTPPTGTAGTVYYYVVVTNTNNSVNGEKTAAAVSNTAAVVVTGVTDAALPVIGVHPVGGVYNQGDTATALTVQASVSDGGTLSYQWYSNAVNSSSGGTAIATGTSYSPPTNVVGTVYYYAVVTNTNNSVNGNKTATAVSNTAAVTVIGGSSTGIKLVFVPGGSFEMGKELNPGSGYSDVTPVHTVTLTGFYMGRTEVTQAQYQAVMGTNPSSFSGDNLPVENVSWYDALVFCNKLSMAEGLTPAYRISNSTDPAAWGSVPTDDNATWNAATIDSGSTGYRLPTEAQWEYAAKGGAGSPGNYTYAGSNTFGDVAWYDGNNGSSGTAAYGTKAVGTKAPNGLGIYDMSGNVYEWCWDWYGSYSSGPQTDPQGASSGSLRVRRGGGWGYPAEFVRSAYRSDYYPGLRSYIVGFRLVRPAQ